MLCILQVWKTPIGKSRTDLPKVSQALLFPLNDAFSLSVWFVVHTLGNAFPSHLVSVM